jgi:hypothetical protein
MNKPILQRQVSHAFSHVWNLGGGTEHESRKGTTRQIEGEGEKGKGVKKE